MKKGLDYIKLWLGYFVGIPFCLSFVLLGAMLVGGGNSLTLLYAISVLLMVVAIPASMHYMKKVRSAGDLVAVWVPALFTSGLLALCMIVSNGFYGHSIWNVFLIGNAANILVYVFAGLFRLYALFAVIPLLYHVLFAVSATVLSLKKHAVFSIRGTVSCFVSVAMLLGVSGFVQYNRSQTVLSGHGFQYGNGYSSVPIYDYLLMNDDNRVISLPADASYKITDTSRMPVLDGAEATIPLYAAFAKAAYSDIEAYEYQQSISQDSEKESCQTDEECKTIAVSDTNGSIVTFTNTVVGFERLVKKDVDIFFGAAPSKAQQELAAAAGVELKLTPIGTEAFVFFVSEDNPLTDLTADQIRDIYSGKITNWKQLGGNDEKIMAFQRPANSGSQSVMVQFMKPQELKAPLKEEYIRDMSGIVERVAEFRKSSQSIGYTFRFYLEGMQNGEGVRMLAIDGIYPSVESIADGSYPLTTNLLAITRVQNDLAEVDEMLAWILGAEGQYLVEQIGYVPIK